MAQDASLPPHAPMTIHPTATSSMNNSTSTSAGLKVKCNGRGEVDASHSSPGEPLLQEVCADYDMRVRSFLQAEPDSKRMRRTQEQTRVALDVMAEALQKYSFEALSFSYNGGKDCLVLLIIYLSALHRHFTQPHSPTTATTFPTTIPSIYAKPPDPFPSVTSFVEFSSRAYRLDLVHIQTTPKGPSSSADSSEPTTTNPTVTFRDAFALYLASHPAVSAIFVGTRRTDPHGAQLTHFDPTDGAWPSFMRIHPVIDWHLGEIWLFLRSPHLVDRRTGKPLAYCPIYDEGYTSLGGTGDTLRNPSLRFVDAAGVERYRPAYVLTEDEAERLGRE